MLQTTPSIEQLSQELADTFRTGEVGDVFADDVFLDGHPPFWRFQIQGLDDFSSWLAGYVAHVPTVTVARTTATADGFLTEHVSSEHDPERGNVTARKVLICTVRDGRVAEMTVFCSGDWDAELRARHAVEARIFRP
jgi:hypothetical protein